MLAGNEKLSLFNGYTNAYLVWFDMTYVTISLIEFTIST